MKLIDAIAVTDERSPRMTTLIMRMGRYVSHTATSVRVTVDEVQLDVARVASYAPAAGDLVVLLVQGGAWVAFGAIPLPTEDE